MTDNLERLLPLTLIDIKRVISCSVLKITNAVELRYEIPALMYVCFSIYLFLFFCSIERKGHSFLLNFALVFASWNQPVLGRQSCLLKDTADI